MKVQYGEGNVNLYLMPENDDERDMLERIYRERVVLVCDGKITLHGEIQKLPFKVFTRK